jgi:hypothetical protein
VTDAWCGGYQGKPPGPPAVPISERGMFDFTWAVSTRRVTDGLSHTIAVGEAAHGPSWLLSTAQASDTIWTGTTYDNHRTQVVPLNSYGQQAVAWQSWVGSEPSCKTLVAATQFYWGNVMACTLEPMNKAPVTSSVADDGSLSNCNKSQIGDPGTRGKTTKNGRHTSSNFAAITVSAATSYSRTAPFIFSGRKWTC